MTQRPPEQGRFLRWLHRDGGGGTQWGSDPGDYDPALVERTVEQAERYFGPGGYFGLTVSGWENVPEAPVMVVSNHSGGTSIPDVWGFGVGWYARFGVGRPLHPLAHEIILSTRATGRYFGRRGVLRANRANAYRALGEYRRDIMVMPGGDRDTWRPYSKRYEVRFAGRRGYAHIALKTGAPIVPVANAGAHETLRVLTDGSRLARALRLPELARASIFPVSLALPWGLAIGPLPHIPWPATLRYRIGAPIYPPPDLDLAPGEDPPKALVAEHDARVRAAVQGLLDELRAADEAEDEART